MKRILFLILISLLTLTAMAQELTIKSFAQSATDITASTEERKDGNGEACALVKVRLALVGATFEGEIRGDVVNHNGEYWVYMLAGSKRLLVKQATVLPLEVNFASHGVNSVEGKNTYVLTLLTPQTGSSSQDDGLRFLSMTVKPTNATVMIDYGQVPVREDGALMLPMAQGQHTYTVSALGYRSQQGTFTIADQKVSLKVMLEQSLTQLTVSCPTEGAAIYINEEKKSDNNSWSGTLSPSTYVIEARKTGYITQRQVVTLQQDQPQTIPLPALIAPMGTLSVSYFPEDAEVWLDGKMLGTSPDIFRNIMAGTHQVELRKEGYQPVSQRVTIEEGKTVSLSGSLVQTTAATQSSSSMPDQSSAASPVAANGAAKTFTVKGVSFTMIAVQGGTFQMGATPEQEDPYDNEKPVHSVTLSDYSIGETEVTQALWEAVMDESVTQKAKGKGRILRSSESAYKAAYSKTYGVGADYPMYNVSWDDCQKFIKKLNRLTGENFRLPTEAEWEYAARGGNKSLNTQYAGSRNIDEVAWYDGNSGSTTHAVKTKQPNELGLYDMSGNVWEWCQDWFGSYSSSSQTNPTGPTSGSTRVIHGGSRIDYARGCRSAARGNFDPTYRNHGIGLRLAL